jgi:pyruvate dehydrogenase E1 component alpha subunit/2-oxoisovalerate dehydrogenase E1 component alpha subunit
MLQTVEEGDPASSKAAPNDRYLEAFRWMLLARIFEEKLTSLYRGGMISGGVYVGRGQEAVSVAGAIFLQKGDIFAPLIRDQAGRFAFGESVLEVARTYLGSRQGPMRGRDGNIHRGRPNDGYLAMISHLGAMTSVTTGALLAKRFKGEKNFVGLTTIGEGGMSAGAFHEGMNIAAVEQVPLVVVATNNHYAYSTPNEREFACHDLKDRAKAYGFEGVVIDGTDMLAVYREAKRAIEKARSGGGPTLIECQTLRMEGHAVHDDAFYVPRELLEAYAKKDPIERYRRWLKEQALLDEVRDDEINVDVKRLLNEAMKRADESPLPEPSELFTGVYAEPDELDTPHHR